MCCTRLAENTGHKKSFGTMGQLCWAVSYLFSFSFFSAPNLIRRRWICTILLYMAWPKCEFRMQVWNVLLAACWKYRTQKIDIMAPSYNFVELYLRCWGMYWQSEKNFLNFDTSSTCPHNMVNFGLLTAEICWRVWGTPANFNGFRVLEALLHGI